MGVIVLGCSNTETISDSSESYIELDADFMNSVIGEEGGCLSITFTASDSWIASFTAVNQDTAWISVLPMKGEAGTITLQIDVLPNDTYDERNIAILLTCGSDEKIITVTQNGGGAMSSEIDDMLMQPW